MAEKVFTIAVDAMGGDYAPASAVDGVKLAVNEAENGLHIVLVGDREKLYSYSPDLDDYKKSISVVHAPQVVGMSESPMEALKTKKESSLVITGHLLKTKKVDAVFSAGNTGAHMASSLFSAGKIEGVARPTIGTFYPYPGGTGFLLDVGANTDCKPHWLLQFGMMGSIFVRHFLKIDNPRIGLLSIGEESSKGNAATIEANKLFSESNLNFIGNVEGRDVFNGAADVIVCDGFVGNILLKLFETYGNMLINGIKSHMSGSIMEQLGFSLISKPLEKYTELFNYENYGGVPLLGLDGISIIGHGSSTPLAFKSAVNTARSLHEDDITGQIRKALEEL